MTKRRERPANPQPTGTAAGLGPAGRGQLWAALLLAAILGLGWLALHRSGGLGRRAADRIGGVTACQHQPRFAATLGLGSGAAFGTAVEGVMGLAIVSAGPDGAPSVYQHPSWDDAGYLGPFTTDAEGNVFTAPVPLVSLVENPLGLQNRLLRIDTDSQVMTELVTLPPAREPSSANPFGVVGLAFDCETGSLYASSLAGSTASEELGRIFQVEAASGRLRSQLDGVDAMGLGVFRGSGGKRLYFGRTRSPELHSVALDATGAFVGAPRLELSLADQVRGGLATPRRLRFGAGPQLRLHMMDFNYSLQVAARREEREIDLRYDPASDRWQLIAADG